MPGEISHIVYGARVLTYLGKRVKTPAYWGGNVFPNIRHLNVQARHHTHTEGITLSSLPGKNDFMTGMRVHAWVDATQGRYLDLENSKETLRWHPMANYAYKLLEDEMLYAKFDDWGLVRRILMKVYEDELFYVNSRPAVQGWHSLLQDYVRQEPTDSSRQIYLEALGLSEAAAVELNDVVRQMRGDARTAKVMLGFWQHFERLLT